MHFFEPTDLETNNFFKAYIDFSYLMLFNCADSGMLWILTKQSNPLIASKNPTASSVRLIRQFFLQMYRIRGEHINVYLCRILEERISICYTLPFRECLTFNF